MSVEPYQIHVPDSQIQALKDRLANTVFPDELEDSGWERGSPLADVKRLANYWRDGYDWRAVEADLNKLPNYKTSIQAEGFEPLDIHFVHQRSDRDNAIPLLFSHGWPGSFIEVVKLLPLLTNPPDPSTPAFHVVAPSLPCYGFSSGTKKRGFNLAQYAETFNKLMLRLGYTQYATQGGDWGKMITRTMGLLYPEHVKASHINLIRAKPPTWTGNPLQKLKQTIWGFSDRDRKGFARGAWFLKEGSGYRSEQETKPQTLGYSLADSPVGLLAWIYEKLHDWTDNYPWTDDEILTWVSIYQFSTAGPWASIRIYYESRHDPNKSEMGPPTPYRHISAPSPNAPSSSTTSPTTPTSPSKPSTVPFVHRERTIDYIGGPKLGMSHFPKELSVVPHTYAATMGDVVYQSENYHGGHFAAHEHPEDIARDLRRMFEKGGPCEGIIKGARGFGTQRTVAKL